MPSEEKMSVLINEVELLRKKNSLIVNSINNQRKFINDIKLSKRYRIGDKIAQLIRRFLPFFSIGEDTNFVAINKEIADQLEVLRDIQKIQISIIVKFSDLSEIPFDNFINIEEEVLYFPIRQSLIDPSDLYFYNLLNVNHNESVEKKVLEQLDDEKLLFSVIMPVFNRASIIKEAIDSVLRQSYKNFELIIIDDGSSDNLLSVIDEYNDPRLKFYRQKNKGVCEARNFGISNSKGEWVTYLDSDNQWEENFLLVFSHEIEKNNSRKTMYCGQRLIDVSNGETREIGLRLNMFYPRILENRNYLDLNCFIHHRSLCEELGVFDVSLSRLVDWELIIRYTNAYAPKVIPNILCDYYMNKADNQITNNEGYKSNLKKMKLLIKGEDLEERILNFLPIHYHGNLYADKKVVDYDISNRKAAVIIPSFEVLDCLKASIMALEAYTSSENYELIIVDNNSSEPVKKYLQELERNKRAKVILNSENQGFTYAVNQGIKLASKFSDIILFNNDAIVTKGWLNALYQAKDLNEEAGLIVPAQILPSRTKTQGVHVPFCDVNYEVDVNLSTHHANVIKSIEKENKVFVEVSFAAFFCVMITRECFQELGYLDHINGRHYKSDRLYCNLAKEKGWKMIYTPYSKVYHLLQQATTVLKKDKTEYKTMFVENTWKSNVPNIK